MFFSLTTFALLGVVLAHSPHSPQNPGQGLGRRDESSSFSGLSIDSDSETSTSSKTANVVAADTGSHTSSSATNTAAGNVLTLVDVVEVTKTSWLNQQPITMATATATAKSQTSSSLAKPTSKATTSSSSTAAPSEICTCGYRTSNYENVVWPHKHSVRFSMLKLKDGPMTSVDALRDYGWIVHDLDGVGVKSEDTKNPVQGTTKKENVLIKDGNLQLVCPGGQPKDKITGARITFNQTVAGGVFHVAAKPSTEGGSVQRFFTFRDKDGTNDKQEYWMVGDNILAKTETYPDFGAHLGSNSPKEMQDGGKKPLGEEKVLAFPLDPTKDYWAHTIGWYKDKLAFYFNGKPYDWTPKYVSTNPSNFHIDNWSNANRWYTGGPPAKDVVLTIQWIEFYYKKTADEKLPDGCTADNACVESLPGSG